jgi:hypothetical protein
MEDEAFLVGGDFYGLQFHRRCSKEGTPGKAAVQDKSKVGLLEESLRNLNAGTVLLVR